MQIIHTESSCGWGGQEIRILEESLGLIGRGHSVQVICPHESRIYEEAAQRNVPAVALPIAHKNIWGFLSLRSWLNQNPVDIINTHSSVDSWLAALACRSLGIKVPLVRTRHISAQPPRNFTSRWLYSRAVQHVVTTGEALRAQLIERVGVDQSRVSSVPTGIDPQRFKPGDKILARSLLGLDTATNYLGIVATLRSWKGHLHLLEALSTLDIPGWMLLIVGDGPMRNTIEAKIEELGIMNRVKLVGQQVRPEEWLQAIDIFVLPSYANEGVPQALLQAMFTGLPIVTTPVGAISEAVTNNDTALVVEAGNPSAIAGALMNLISNPLLCARLGLNARRAAQSRFTKTVMLDRMETIFLRVQDQTR